MALDLSAIVRNGVAVADSITKSLQATVTHSAYIGQDRNGSPMYGPTLPYRAVVEYHQETRKADEGTQQVPRVYIMFVQPVPPNGAPDRSEPIDERDMIILPDGTTGTILEVRGVVDPAINRPYYSEVWMGKIMKV